MQEKGLQPQSSKITVSSASFNNVSNFWEGPFQQCKLRLNSSMLNAHGEKSHDIHQDLS